MTRWVLLALLALQQPETMSLLGEPLFAPPLAKTERAAAARAAADARHAYEKAPNDKTAILAFERASLALGRVGDALEILTRGLEAHPDDAAMLSDRGWCFVLIRKFDVAERDLRKAAATVPAAKCTLAFDMYLAGEFARARDAYAECADGGAFRTLAARRAAATHDPARSTPQPPAGTLIKFPGSVSQQKKEAPQPLDAAYSSAIDRLIAGDTDAARAALKTIVEKNRRTRWMEPAYIAAEADYARVIPKKKGKKKL